MCGCITALLNGSVRRRGILSATAVGATAVGAASVGMFAAPAARAAEQLVANQHAALSTESASSRTRLILLGTAGGPTYWPGSNRSSASSVLMVGDAAYMVDCGAGAGKRLQEALDAPLRTESFRTLRALFVTHLHSDHTVDYPNLLLYGYYSGLDLPGRPALQVYGPGQRGQLEPVFTQPGKTPATPAVFSPSNPTPGTEDLTSLLLQAYATDINDRIRDNGRRDPAGLVQAHDIAIPAIPGFVSPNDTPSPPMAPFKIYEDDRVRVSAILVNHAPIWPAFAYRFDTDDGSVVFSGDTGPCDNLVTLADKAEILVHEVIVPSWIDSNLPSPRTPAQEGLRAHLLSAHTPVAEVGKLAQRAGVGMLVLNHLLPGNAHALDLLPAQLDFPGPMIIGDDLLQIGVRRRV